MAVPQGPVRLAVDPSPPKDNDGNLPALLRSRIRSRFRKWGQRVSKAIATFWQRSYRLSVSYRLGSCLDRGRHSVGCLCCKWNDQDLRPWPRPDRHDHRTGRHRGRLDRSDGVGPLLHAHGSPCLNDSCTHRSHRRHRLRRLRRRRIDLVRDREKDCPSFITQPVPRLRRLSTYPSSCSRAREEVGRGLLVRDAGIAGAGGDRSSWGDEDLVSSRTLRLAGHGSTAAMRPRRLAGAGRGTQYDSLDLQQTRVVCLRHERRTEDRGDASLGIATPAWPSTSSQLAAFGGVALAMGLGTYFGGLRVTEVLVENVTRMDHAEGLSANLATSSLVLLSGSLGLPVSTTHVSSSAIIGIGPLKGLNSVRWTTVRDMVLAWVVTLPASALFACIAYLILSKVL